MRQLTSALTGKRGYLLNTQLRGEDSDLSILIYGADLVCTALIFNQNLHGRRYDPGGVPDYIIYTLHITFTFNTIT